MAFTLFMIIGLLRLNDYNVVYFEVDVAVAISVYMFFYVGGYAVINGPLGWLVFFYLGELNVWDLF